MTHNDKKISNGLKKTYIILLAVIIALLAFVLYYKRIAIKDWFINLEKQELPIETPVNNTNSTSSIPNPNPATTTNNNVTSTPNSQIKSEINLKVPFTIQSPNQKWEGIYKEACEEASVLMVYGFLSSKEITVDFAMTQIADMINWENINITTSEDITSEQTLELARGFYKLGGEVIKLNSIADIKKIVSKGNPVILPVLGRELGNPNFRYPGPLYHMLVVKGYTKDGMIITNDPGTRLGKNYLYDPEILWNAIADWDIDMKSPNANRKVGILLID